MHCTELLDSHVKMHRPFLRTSRDLVILVVHHTQLALSWPLQSQARTSGARRELKHRKPQAVVHLPACISRQRVLTVQNEQKIGKAIQCQSQRAILHKGTGQELTLGPQSRVQPSLMGISTTVTFSSFLKTLRAFSAAVPGLAIMKRGSNWEMARATLAYACINRNAT